jgi:hypothetical protein
MRDLLNDIDDVALLDVRTSLKGRTTISAAFI